MATVVPVVAGIIGFIVLDGLWLGLIMSGFYRTALGPIARTNPDGTLALLYAAAAPVYVLLSLGEFWFVMPRVAGGSIMTTLGWGAAFGLVMYGLYDFTNWSTLRGYSATLAFTDIAWGMVTCAINAVLMKALIR